MLEAKSYRSPEVNGLKNSIDRHKGQAPKRKGTEVRIYGVPQERRRTVNPLRRKTEFLANETVKVNPNGGNQGGIPVKESPRIANKESDQNGQQKELVPRCPRENSNKNPSGSKSAVTAKAKGNP